jgi:uncharacterized protein YciU (UPF0263 family)
MCQNRRRNLRFLKKQRQIKKNQFFLKERAYSILVVLMLLIVSVTFVQPVSANQRGQLDQYNTIGDGQVVVTIGPDYTIRWAQSFKPTMPVLTNVELCVGTYIYTSSNLKMHIRSSLTGANLATVEKTASQIPFYDYQSWVNFNFDDIVVTPESTYYIVLETTSFDPYSGGYLWWYSNSNPYPRGTTWYRYDSNSWQQNPSYDLRFKTYGSEYVPPPGSPSGLNAGNPTPTSIDLSWNKGSGADYTMIRRKTGSYPSNVNDGAQAYYGTGTSTTDSGLNSGTKYYYRAWAYHSYSNQYSTGYSSASATTTPNQPPNTPSKPSGPDSGYTLQLRSYSTSAIDPNGDQVYYLFDWDDGTTSGWLGPYNSGTTKSCPKIWNDPGTYNIRAKAKDVHGAESGWSQPKTVVITEQNHPPGPPTNLLCNDQTNPQNIKNTNPVFSAIYNDQNSGDTATSLQIQVGTNDNWGVVEMWDHTQSCQVAVGSRSPDIQYAGNQLEQGTNYYWRIRFKDGVAWGDWSETANFKTRLFNKIINDPTIDFYYNSLTIYTPFISLDPFPSNENEWFNGYGYGNKINFEEKYVRSGVFAEVPSYWPFYLINYFTNTLIGVTIDVPVITQEGAYHSAHIRAQGQYEGWMKTNALANSRITTTLSVEENNNVYPPYNQPVGTKELSRDEILILQEQYPSGSFTFESNSMFVHLREGKSYRIWLEACSSILLFSVQGFDGEGLADNKVTFDGIKIEWTNPYKPPTYQNTPEIQNFSSSVNETKMGQPVEFTASATNPENVSIYYRFYWDDGNESEWLGPYPSGETISKTYTYAKPGVYSVRVQAKENSEYGIIGPLSDPLNVTVLPPDGIIYLQSPNASSVWHRNTNQIIEWGSSGDIGPDVMLLLYKKTESNDYEYLHSINDEPINSLQGYYIWSIDNSIETGIYKIIIVNIAGLNESEEFTLIGNSPPYTPSNPNPIDSATDIELDITLSWNGGDPDPDDIVTYDIYFSDNPSPQLVNNNQSEMTYHTSGLEYETTYYWKIVAWDNHGASTTGPIWSFTTRMNNPPYIPSNPNPIDSATDIELDITLSWNGGDPDPDDIVTYDIYFSDNPSPQLVNNNQSEMTYHTSGLEYETTYYWKIVAWDNHGASTTGPIWSFTTRMNNPPYIPSNPSPEDGAVDVEVDAVLSWSGGDPDPGDIVTYDVYFGVDSPPVLVSTGQLETSYDPGTMIYNTTYYWKIIAYDSHGASTSGPLWSFITKSNDCCIQVWTAQDLYNVRNDLSACYVQMADIDLGCYNNWKPVGDNANSFVGIYNGQGYNITGLTILRPIKRGIGLFGYISDEGEIKNVNLVNADVAGLLSYVGGLVGFNAGSVSNSYATGKVTGLIDAGGLVGYNKGTIYNSYTAAKVKTITSPNFNLYVGGLVGFNSGSVSNSYATGKVTGLFDAGGLVGRNSGSVSNSYATGEVTVFMGAGGLVGLNNYGGSVSNSYATGKVTTVMGYVGGLVGSNGRGSVSNSFYDKQTTGQSDTDKGIPKTTAEMQDIATFADAGWDIAEMEYFIDETWRIDNGNDYPRLGSIDNIVPNIVSTPVNQQSSIPLKKSLQQVQNSFLKTD